MVEYLRTAVARGDLVIEDFDLAADQFAELCKVDAYHGFLCGVTSDYPPARRDRVIEGAIEMFLARYGARG